jgi:hypothetical protein
MKSAALSPAICIYRYKKKEKDTDKDVDNQIGISFNPLRKEN